MGLYKYKCGHTGDYEILAKGIRRCKECNMIIITDRGADPKIQEDWDSV